MEGESLTLISKDLVSKVNLSGDSKVLDICNAILEVSKVECKSVEFQISVCNSFKKLNINAFVVDILSVQPPNSFKISSLKND